MRYATPTRSAHRAPLVRLPVAGQHRRRSQRHLWREPYPAAHLLARGLAALIVLGICVMLGVLVVADERRPRQTGTLTSAEVDARIASRTADPEPLTAAEVFPAGSAGFRAGPAELSTDCSVAATGALRFTLQRYGCSQAVRATVTVPYADYRITAGLLNLADTAGAAAVSDQVRYLVETGDGGFALLTGDPTAVPGTPVVWRARGHYVMYCVITGPAGDPVPADAPQVQQVTAELLDSHLHDRVLISRAS